MTQPTSQRLLVEAQLGAANGAATLDSGLKVPVAQVPDAVKTATGAKPVGKGELAKNVRDYKNGADPDDTAAITAAHTANPAVYYPDGDYSPGATRNLYNSTSYKNAMGPRWQAARDGAPTTDARPVMWVQKHSSANRATNPAEWDNGAGYFGLIKESGNAFGASLSAYARHGSADGGQLVSLHSRAYAAVNGSEVWAGWFYAMSNNTTTPTTVIGIETNLNVQHTDPGWTVGGGAGSSIGHLIVTADGGGNVTQGMVIGKGLSGVGKFWTGLLVKSEGIVPSGANTAGQINNGEAFRIMGSANSVDSYGGIRFQSGNLNYAMSTAEVSIANNAAIVLKSGHRIVVGGTNAATTGASPTSTKYLEFNAETSQLNMSNLTLAFGGTQVVSSRKTGWGAVIGGTVDRTAWTPYAAATVSATYVQAELQAVANAVQANSRHLAALQQDLTSHGLIGA